MRSILITLNQARRFFILLGMASVGSAMVANASVSSAHHELLDETAWLAEEHHKLDEFFEAMEAVLRFHSKQERQYPQIPAEVCAFFTQGEAAKGMQLPTASTFPVSHWIGEVQKRGLGSPVVQLMHSQDNRVIRNYELFGSRLQNFLNVCDASSPSGSKMRYFLADLRRINLLLSESVERYLRVLEQLETENSYQ